MTASQPDVVIIGAGPAGLTAGLNLVRARRSVLLVDTNRPRHAPTLHSHGTLGLDGIPPLELRKIGREQFLAYPGAEHTTGLVSAVAPDLTVSVSGVRGGPDLTLQPRAVLVATGLTEVLPSIENLRAYYGTALHSCIECDAYEESGKALALLGSGPDLATRALEIAHWAPDLIVFSSSLSEGDTARLARAGIAVEREPVVAIEGERAVMTGIRLESGRVVVREGGFVRPDWVPQAAFLSSTDASFDDAGRVIVDARFRTTAPGLYAAGDVTAREPMQIAVAAGEGAVVARTIHLDLLDDVL
ncbi:NAD(P)/FAD-dependent oxidoreductase [Gryllotalpicola protaetiae]|uniref:NAD(P)/FAD-dependent oxidoreductase n=1 Tax=Gryllotalpicola protaetiae TaxID=2419771 RepID=A0A387BEB5_9MICO|nr:NAD(P)/FAD-dependent oxidoreductase [Gryllotalpicola protaetiae]AYG02243.1 NAD(P)/FAD-dependent oxidoreductase [Gryllotalpicola protaetiae]